MEQLPEFLLNHPFLSTAFIAIFGALLYTTFQPGGNTRLSPTDATRLISHEDAVVLDVRADGEYEAGHIVNSVHLPADQLETSIRKLEKYRSRPIIATCQNGQRAAAAVKTLKAHGFERLYTLSGGVNAWANASLPLSRES
tara:strand:- start:362 stop:784 length:423 start_codon:yes stop_codon:yes gene_type:complete